MEQLLKIYNPLMNVSIVLMMVWLVCACLTARFQKEKLYIAEMLVLLINATVSIYYAYISSVQDDSLDWCIIFAGWAVLCLGLLVIVIKEYEKRFL